MITVEGRMRGLFAIIGVALVLALALTPVFVAAPVLLGDQAAYAAEEGKAGHSGPIYTNPVFWFVLLIVGVVGLVAANKMNMLDNTVVAVLVSLLIAISYFHIVDHYLMDMQGLDYWYLFRG
jgi:hypothetical protein